jgi:hypothetical protein
MITIPIKTPAKRTTRSRAEIITLTTTITEPESVASWIFSEGPLKLGHLIVSYLVQLWIPFSTDQIPYIKELSTGNNTGFLVAKGRAICISAKTSTRLECSFI